MIVLRIKNDYYYYLLKLINYPTMEIKDYDLLLRLLFSTPYYSDIVLDKNRIYDALEMRSVYITDTLGLGITSKKSINIYEILGGINMVSLLEVWVCLSKRFAKDIFGIEDKSFLFWHILSMTGLRKYVNSEYEDFAVRKKVNDILDKKEPVFDIRSSNDSATLSYLSASLHNVKGLSKAARNKIDKNPIFVIEKYCDLWSQMNFWITCRVGKKKEKDEKMGFCYKKV